MAHPTYMARLSHFYCLPEFEVDEVLLGNRHIALNYLFKLFTFTFKIPPPQKASDNQFRLLSDITSVILFPPLDNVQHTQN